MLNTLRAAALTSTLLACLAVPVQASWELDNARSTINFMSVKNTSIAELHHFKALSGGISDAGQVQLRIDLDTVETLIPIRNQRMRELLFETVQFPTASLSASIPEAVGDLAVGETGTTALDVTLELHGMQQTYRVDVVINKNSDGSLQAVLREPMLIKAADFGLAGGIEMLREVAGLDSINTVVPVSAHLVFTPGDS